MPTEGGGQGSSRPACKHRAGEPAIEDRRVTATVKTPGEEHHPMSVESTTTGTSIRYDRIRGMIARDECVILDGAMGTELIKVRGSDRAESEQLWGLMALLEAPEDVARVHRSYIDVGCDVVCTNTWGLPTALRDGGVGGGVGGTNSPRARSPCTGWT
jgi:Homocysteine S-methyltransferase